MRASKKVLFVDDETNVLQSIRRSLRKQVELDVASSGNDALELMRTNSQYALIVSDMRMPKMNGVELLTATRKEFPETVRMMLTGNADQETAVAAVNHGDIFRFLNKPCDPPVLLDAVRDGIRQHELITAERDLLENTVRGGIKALSEVLSLTNPRLFGRTTRLRTLMRRVAEAARQPDVWRLESAAMLSQLGCVSLPEELVERRMNGEPLNETELEQFAQHAVIGADIIKSIPRLNEVAESVRYQEKNFDGSGFPNDQKAGDQIPLGARFLKAILDFDSLQTSSGSAADALRTLLAQRHCYDPDVLVALESCAGTVTASAPRRVSIAELNDDMTLARDLRTKTNLLIVSKGQQTTMSVRCHMQSFLKRGLIDDSVEVQDTGS